MVADEAVLRPNDVQGFSPQQLNKIVVGWSPKKKGGGIWGNVRIGMNCTPGEFFDGMSALNVDNTISLLDKDMQKPIPLHSQWLLCLHHGISSDNLRSFMNQTLLKILEVRKPHASRKIDLALRGGVVLVQDFLIEAPARKMAR